MLRRDISQSAASYIGTLELGMMDLPVQDKIRVYESHNFSRNGDDLSQHDVSLIRRYISGRIEELRRQPGADST